MEILFVRLFVAAVIVAVAAITNSEVDLTEPIEEAVCHHQKSDPVVKPD